MELWRFRNLTLTLSLTLTLYVSDKWPFGQVNSPRCELTGASNGLQFQLSRPLIRLSLAAVEFRKVWHSGAGLPVSTGCCFCVYGQTGNCDAYSGWCQSGSDLHGWSDGLQPASCARSLCLQLLLFCAGIDSCCYMEVKQFCVSGWHLHIGSWSPLCFPVFVIFMFAHSQIQHKSNCTITVVFVLYFLNFCRPQWIKMLVILL